MKEWPLPKAEKYWPADELKVERKFLYPQSLVPRNDNKKSTFKGVILFRITPFFYIKGILETIIHAEKT